MLELKVAENKDFNEIYKDMERQFPPEERKSFEAFNLLLQQENYKLILAVNDGQTAGYIIVFCDRTERYLWLDYIAVYKEFQSSGFGGRMLEGLKKLFPDCYGIFLEVEKPDENVADTLRRIKFYQKHGAVLVNSSYLYPNKEGFLPMDLYCIPYSSELPATDKIFQVIRDTFDALHKDLEHKDSVYDLIVRESRVSDAD